MVEQSGEPFLPSLSLAACRTPRNSLGHAFPTLCRAHVRLNDVSPESVPFPPQPPPKGCPSLFDWFTGTTAQSDFSCTFASAARFVAFFGPVLFFSSKTYRRSPGSRACCFLSVRGFLDYAGPTIHLRLAWFAVLPSSLPETESASCSIGFSKLNSPAHRYLCLRFKRHTSRCRLQDSRPGWIRCSLSCRALSSPTTCRFIPALSRLADTTRPEPRILLPATTFSGQRGHLSDYADLTRTLRKPYLFA